MTGHAESYLDDVLKRTGPEQLDFQHIELGTSSLIGEYSADDTGLIPSLTRQRSGTDIDGIGAYLPGADAAHNIDIRATLIAGEYMARKVTNDAAPSRLHFVYDSPERLDHLTGDYAARNIGNFMLSICGHVSRAANAQIVVYHNDGNTAGLVHEGYSGDLEFVFSQLDGKAKRYVEEAAGSTALSSMLQLVEQRIDYQHDALVVVSDFVDEFDQESGDFAWGHGVQRLDAELDGRLWATRIASPAQIEAPPVVSDAMPLETIQTLNRDFASLAEKKARALEKLELSLNVDGIERWLTVNTFRAENKAHPVDKMTSFILGEVAE